MYYENERNAYAAELARVNRITVDEALNSLPAYECDIITALNQFGKNIFNFKGRASRAEYWWMMLVFMMASELSSMIFGSNSIIGGLVSIAIFVIELALTTRRFHDINKSGKWLILFMCVPFACIMFMVMGFVFPVFILIGMLIIISDLIAAIVFTLLPPDPRGIRFDKYQLNTMQSMPAMSATQQPQVPLP